MKDKKRITIKGNILLLPHLRDRNNGVLMKAIADENSNTAAQLRLLPRALARGKKLIKQRALALNKQ